MARIQLPSVRQQVQQPVGFDAPRVAPLQDAAPQQLQALGQAQQAFGVSGSRISADLQDEYDAAILNKADLAADGVLNEEFGGYLSLQGEQATGTAKKDATAAATKRIRAIQESGLKTAAQRTIFEQQTTSRMQEWTQRADRHERDQVRNFAFGMHTAKAQSEGMDAAATVGTPMFLAHKDQMLAHVDSAADLQGLGADQKKLLRLGATTTLHKTIIDNMVVGGHATAAKDYLDGAQDEIAPEQRTRLQGAVERATVDKESTDLQFEIMAKVPKPDTELFVGVLQPGRYATPAEMDTAWRGAYDDLDARYKAGTVTPELRDATRGRLREAEAQQRGQRAGMISATAAEAEKFLIDHPDASVQQLPAATYKEAERWGILPDLNAFADSGRRYSTDPRLWAAVSSLTDAELQAIPVDELSLMRGKLDPQQMNTVLARRARAVGKATPDMASFLSIKDRQKFAAQQLGILPMKRDANAEEMQNYNAWTREIDQRMQSQQERLGKKFGDKEVQQFLDSEVLDKTDTVAVGKTLGEQASDMFTADFWLHNGTIGRERRLPLADVPQVELRNIHEYVRGEKVYLRDVPPPVLEHMKKYLLQRSVRPTPGAILDLWVADGKPLTVE